MATTIRTTKRSGNTTRTTSSSPGRQVRTTVTTTTKSGNTTYTNRQVYGGQSYKSPKPPKPTKPSKSTYKPPKPFKFPKLKTASRQPGASQRQENPFFLLLVGGAILVVVALYYAALGISFVLTSPGTLFAAAWMKLNSTDLPASTIWYAGVGAGLFLFTALWFKLHDLTRTTQVYSLIAILAVVTEYFIGVRAFEFGESKPPYVRTWLNQKPPPTDEAVPIVSDISTQIAPAAVVTLPPAEPPKQEPLVWRDIIPAAPPTQQSPQPESSGLQGAVPPAPSSVELNSRVD